MEVEVEAASAKRGGESDEEGLRQNREGHPPQVNFVPCLLQKLGTRNLRSFEGQEGHAGK